MWGRAETEFGQFASKYPRNPPTRRGVVAAGAGANSSRENSRVPSPCSPMPTIWRRPGRWPTNTLIGPARRSFRTGILPTRRKPGLRLAQKFPESPSRLRAVVEAAAAFGQMTNWSKVDDLLGRHERRLPAGGATGTRQRTGSGRGIVAGKFKVSAARFSGRDGGL